MKMLIVTAKHHDGFCLWPSQLHEHSVKSSPWRGGKGDVVGEVAGGLPRNRTRTSASIFRPGTATSRSYGDSPRYNEFFREPAPRAADELRPRWPKSGSTAPAARGRTENARNTTGRPYYQVIRELQPEAVIAIMGPDVRWVGTESGYGRETEWSVVPADLSDLDEVVGALARIPSGRSVPAQGPDERGPRQPG